MPLGKSALHETQAAQSSCGPCEQRKRLGAGIAHVGSRGDGHPRTAGAAHARPLRAPIALLSPTRLAGAQPRPYPDGIESRMRPVVASSRRLRVLVGLPHAGRMGVYGKSIALRIQARRVARRAWREMLSLVGRAPVEPDFTPVTYSYYLRETAPMGITATLLPNQVLRLERAGVIRNLYHSYSDFDGDGSLRIAGDKVLCSTLLQRAGVPVPAFTVLAAADWRQALAFQQQVGADIVIKPAGNTGDSLGVVINPQGARAVRRAMFQAGAYCPRVLVECFAPGSNYRLLYCNHRFLAATARIPAAVTGDGARTIRQLIDAANEGRLPPGDYYPFDAKPRPLRYRIALDRDVLTTLGAQGLTPESVVPAGTVVRLQSICHWLRGGAYRDVTDDVHPALIEAGRQATLATGTKLAGVDLIAQDLRSAAPGSYVINEVNTTPGVLVHYEVENQDKLRPVCREILREMFGIG